MTPRLEHSDMPALVWREDDVKVMADLLRRCRTRAGADLLLIAATGDYDSDLTREIDAVLARHPKVDE